MRFWFFSEMAYPKAWKPEYPSLRVNLSNDKFDPEVGTAVLNRHFDEWILADELGFDIMTNEHHSTATCLAVSPSITLGILARQTKKARLLALGHAVSHRSDPVRVAEETAFVDVISGGRLEVGLVRAAPPEFAATNANPADVMNRYWEAHDLILKAWTTHDGPFNWEGRHFHHRQVNIWPRPVQRPHPPVWISGTSAQTGKAAAEKGYVFATFFGGLRAREWLDAYRERYLEVWKKPATDDRFACLALLAVGETEEEGRRRGDQMRSYLRTAVQVTKPFSSPPGLIPAPVYAQMLRKSSGASIFGTAASSGAKAINIGTASVDELIEAGIMFAGNPDQVARQIASVADQMGGMGNFLMMGQAGELSHRDTTSSMKLFAKEVMPRFQSGDETVLRVKAG